MLELAATVVPPQFKPRPLHNVTVDVVVVDRGPLGYDNILLIQRKNEPFKDHWALPGGFVDLGETTVQAAVRELREETGLVLSQEALFLLGVFDRPGRDPRAPIISIVFKTWGHAFDVQILAGDDAKSVRWWPVDALPPLAFDHAEVIDPALYGKKNP